MGNYVRQFWRLMCVVCSICALGLVLYGDATGAILTVLSGGAFFLMSEWSHSDLDEL
jgi:hypothetical protein